MDDLNIAASGTLVMVFPTADGLVVAADSRTRFRGKLYDVRDKLHRADTRAPIVFAITGSGDFPDALPVGVAPEFWLRHCSYAFRGKDIVQTHLERSPEFLLSEVSLHEVARTLAVAYCGFFLHFPTKATEFEGHGICRLALCQVNPADGEMRFGSIGLAIDADGLAGTSDSRFVAYQRTYSKSYELIGETDFVIEHVLNGAGLQFIASEDLATWEAKRFVHDVKGHEAAHLARSIIAAADKISETIPLPSGNGIGGPVSSLLVTATSVLPI